MTVQVVFQTILLLNVKLAMPAQCRQTFGTTGKCREGQKVFFAVGSSVHRILGD